MARHLAATALAALTLVSAVAQADIAAPGDSLVTTLRGRDESARLGSSMTFIDIDGDERPELLVGAPGLTSSGGEILAGAVYALTDGLPDSLPAPFLRSDEEHAFFGSSIAAGDLNEDGHDDLVVGAPGSSPDGRIAAGAALLWFGPLDAGRPPDVVVEGLFAGDRLGVALLIADADNDGAPDLLVAAPRGGSPDRIGFGTASIIPSSRIALATGNMRVDVLASTTIRGDAEGDALSALASGDLDGDGRYETIVGAPQADGDDYEYVDAGLVAIFTLADESPDTLRLSDADAIVRGAVARGFLGSSIATGDLTGDGYDELLIGAPTAGTKDEGGAVSGTAYVFFGSEEGLPPVTNLTESGAPVFYSSRWELFADAIAGEDVDGDLTDDLVVGAPLFPCEQDETRCGGVVVYRGSLRSVIAAKAGSAERADLVVRGSLVGGGLGSALAVGDVDGDGRRELVIGAPDADSPGGASNAGALHIVASDALER